MSRFREMLEHPSHLVSRRRASRLAHEAADTIHERPGSILGVVALLAVILGIVWMYPEIRRYLKIERM